MPSLNRRSFLDQVCSQIKWKAAHREICAELDAHIEDRMERLERLGRDKEEAEFEAVAAMGDPIQIGKELNRYHKPYLSWLFHCSWVLIIFLIVFFIATVLWPWGSRLYAQNQPVRTNEKVIWTLDAEEQTQQIDNRIVYLTGADFTESGILYVYWKSELLAPYQSGWSFALNFDVYDQNGNNLLESIGYQTQMAAVGGIEHYVMVFRDFDAESIEKLTFIYDQYHRHMEFTLDLMQKEAAE